jgi:hypothetical protein
VGWRPGDLRGLVVSLTARWFIWSCLCETTRHAFRLSLLWSRIDLWLLVSAGGGVLLPPACAARAAFVHPALVVAHDTIAVIAAATSTAAQKTPIAT